MKAVNPYLNFNGQAEEAFKFYQSVFGGELEIIRYNEMEDTMGATDEDLKLVANAALSLTGDIKLFGSDILDSFEQDHKRGNDFYINLETESEEETERLFKKLSDGGEVEMPLENTGSAEKFGEVKDQFGIRWMVYYQGTAAI
ncbi:VOC family protein [Halalkalibaculum sp. DA384]|uniref:VOC family protein n=1 Tax=Halalkalibaculum sp. DA384 TaxID=3373606 RepID=UPI003754212C